MSETMVDPRDWRDRGRRIMGAVVVVTCYLIVFAGILYSMISGAS